MTRLAILCKILFNEEISGPCQRAILNITNNSDVDGELALIEMVNEMRSRLNHVNMTVNDLADDVFLKCIPQKPTARSRLEGPFFRGVAKNGNTGWQIMCMIRGKQCFIGTVDNVNMAALIYDIISVQSNGLDIKSNLSYSKLDIIAVLSIEQVFDEKVGANLENAQVSEPFNLQDTTQISKE